MDMKLHTSYHSREVIDKLFLHKGGEGGEGGREGRGGGQGSKAPDVRDSLAHSLFICCLRLCIRYCNKYEHTS